MVVQIPDIGLTVQIDPGQRCFDLNEEDKLMGPDDWAWRFLRLNKQYQNSYLEAYGKRRLVIDEAGFRPKPISWNLEILPEMIRTVPVVAADSNLHVFSRNERVFSSAPVFF